VKDSDTLIKVTQVGKGVGGRENKTRDKRRDRGMNDSSWKTNKEAVFCVVAKKRQKECCLPLYLLILVIRNVVLCRFILLLCFKVRIRPVHSPLHCATEQMRNCVRIRRPSSMDRNGVALEPAPVAARLQQKRLEMSFDF
jgi:hypothetical protein